MDRLLLIIVNVLAIAIVALLGITTLENIGEPFSWGLLLTILIILVLLAYLDTRKRLRDMLFKGRQPADDNLFRLIRLLLKFVNIVTLMVAVLIWLFAWFYLRMELFLAVIDICLLASPIVCLNLLLFIRDCLVIGKTHSGCIAGN